MSKNFTIAQSDFDAAVASLRKLAKDNTGLCESDLDIGEAQLRSELGIPKQIFVKATGGLLVKHNGVKIGVSVAACEIALTADTAPFGKVTYVNAFGATISADKASVQLFKDGAWNSVL